MYYDIFKKFDDLLEIEHKEATALGILGPGEVTLKVFGQGGLMMADLEMNLIATRDIDAYAEAKHGTLIKLDKFLKKHGLEFDFLSNEVWMPDETIYKSFYKGSYLAVLRADVEFIMISKALKAPAKNKSLLVDYLSSKHVSDNFFKMAEKYEIDLKEVLHDK